MSVVDDDYHSSVGEALMVLIDGLTPFVERVFISVLPPGVEWVDVLRRKDAVAGRCTGNYRSRDLSLMLRAMTERLGDLGFPFSRHLSRQGQAYASELREVRNRWAHNETFTAQEAYRAIDSAELLLRAIGQEVAAGRVAELKPSASVPGQHNQPAKTLAVRTPEAGVSRSLDEVSLIEIGNAMLVVADQSGGIGSEELMREALNLLGGKRITQSVRTRLDQVLARAIERGHLCRSESEIVYASR